MSSTAGIFFLKGTQSMSKKDKPTNMKEDKLQIIPYDTWSKIQNRKNRVWYDRIIAMHTSVAEAVFVSNFLYLWNKFQNADTDGIFIVPKRFKELTGISPYTFRKIVHDWEKKEILETKSKNLPLKKYYKLNTKMLSIYLSCIYTYGAAHLVEFDKISYRIDQVKVVEFDKIYNKSKIEETIKDVSSQKSETDSTVYITVLAMQINKIVQKTKTLTHKVRISTWEKQIKALHKDYTQQEIVNTLEWYIKHYKDKYVPRIHTPKLQEVFPRIVNVKRIVEEKAKEKEDDIKTDNIKVGKKAKSIAERLLFDGFPKTTKEDLQVAVQISINNYRAYKTKHNQLIEQEEKKAEKKTKQRNGIKSSNDTIISGFAKYLSKTQGSTYSFIQDWFEDFGNTVGQYKGWHGNLQRCIFTVDNKRFITSCTEIAREYSDENRWTKYKRALDKLQ